MRGPDEREPDELNRRVNILNLGYLSSISCVPQTKSGIFVDTSLRRCSVTVGALSGTPGLELGSTVGIRDPRPDSSC
jgi:hypothetical protein